MKQNKKIEKIKIRPLYTGDTTVAEKVNEIIERINSKSSEPEITSREEVCNHPCVYGVYNSSTNRDTNRFCYNCLKNLPDIDRSDKDIDVGIKQVNTENTNKTHQELTGEMLLKIVKEHKDNCKGLNCQIIIYYFLKVFEDLMDRKATPEEFQIFL